MTLIKSISGIRGTIGGKKGENLTPEDVVLYTASYAQWLIENSNTARLKVVLGRDGRISGEMIANLVTSSLNGMGIDVIDLDLSTTPTVEIAVSGEHAHGGIIITASHNPSQWNALKLLNDKGEFISDKDGQRIIEIADSGAFEYATVEDLGHRVNNDAYLKKHIDLVLDLPLVNKDSIKRRKFKVVVDAVNSTGGLFIPELLRNLGVDDIVEINCEVNGQFAHNPEPLKENLTTLSAKVVEVNADLGIAVDPDVDRLVFVQEDGELFGEEYSLVAISDYILSHKKGNTVSNLSSTRALRDVTEKHGGIHYASAVGEVNVVQMMKDKDAVIGGEGNGGIIYPDLHFGRDALVGVALFLTHLSLWDNGNAKISQLRDSYPKYFMSKNKIVLSEGIDIQYILDKLSMEFKNEDTNAIDGLKIDFEDEWVHLRKSNTEPIIRIYSESKSLEKAEALSKKIMDMIMALNS